MSAEIIDERHGLPSASGIERIALCPASWKRENVLPREEGGEDAKSGERIHSALAAWASGRFAGVEMELPISEFCGALVEDEARTAEMCAESVERLVSEWLGNDMLDTAETIIERRMWLYDEADRKLLSGKPDLVLIAGNRALAIDYKTGRNAVATAAANHQLRTLALLSWQELEDIESIRVAIVQPWAGKPTVCDYTGSDISQAWRELKSILAESENPMAVAVPGIEQCRYCRARTTCLEAQSYTLSISNAEIDERKGAIVTPEQIGILLDRCELAGKMIEAIRSKAKRMLEDGVEIPGWKLKPGAVRESVSDVQKVFARVSALGVDAPTFSAACSITKKNLKNIVKGATGAKGKALDEKLAEVLDGCTDSKQSAPSLERSEVCG